MIILLQVVRSAFGKLPQREATLLLLSDQDPCSLTAALQGHPYIISIVYLQPSATFWQFTDTGNRSTG